MNKYRIVFSPKSEKELRKLPKVDAQKVLKAIMSLLLDPCVGKKLKGPFQGFYSIRAWPYRIIYTLDSKESVVVIFRIGPRKDVYEQ